MAPLRHAAVIGSGLRGTAIAVALARAGIDVELGTTGDSDLPRPGVELGPRIKRISASELDLRRRDVVVFTVPASELESVVAEHGPRVSERTGVLVASTGLVPPDGTLPSEYVAQRTSGSAVGVLAGPPDVAEAFDGDAAFVLASRDAAFARQVETALRAAKLRVTRRDDMAGVELASCARAAAALAAATAAAGGPDAQIAAVGQVVAEIDAFARRIGAKLETFTGVAGAGDVAAIALAGSGGGDQLADAVADVPLLAARLREAGLDAPALDGLAGIIEGSIEPGAWTSSLARPTARAAA
jgi:glycerol-3-phosphate dehydrogenase